MPGRPNQKCLSDGFTMTAALSIGLLLEISSANWVMMCSSFAPTTSRSCEEFRYSSKLVSICLSKFQDAISKEEKTQGILTINGKNDIQKYVCHPALITKREFKEFVYAM